MFLNDYRYILLSYTWALIYQYIQYYLFGYYLLHVQLVKEAQFLNITFSGVLFAAAPAEAVLLTVIFPLTSISFNICITVIT